MSGFSSCAVKESDEMKNILIILLLVSVSFCLATGVLHGKEKEMPAVIDMGDPLERLHDLAEIGTDGKFITMLSALDQGENIEAPGKMRLFLEQFSVIGMKISAGYNHENGKAVLVWVVQDMIVPGYREQINKRLQDVIKMAGFSMPRDAGTSGSQLSMTLDEGGVIQTVNLSKSQEIYVGGRPVVKLGFVWRVDDTCTSSLQTLARLTGRFSYFKDRRIGDSFYQDLGSLEVEYLAVGGANRGAYDWNVTLVKSEKMKRDDLYKVVKGALDKRGCVQGASEKDLECYSLPGTKMKAYLRRLGQDQKIRLFVVPESSSK